jgi:histidinol-phosphate aminotransferase
VTGQLSASRVRERVRSLQAVAHGSAAAAELAHYGLTPSTVLDFSVNTNPLGPAPVVMEAVRQAEWSRYPGDDDAPLRRGLANHLHVEPDQVALGNGSAELMWLIALALLEPGDRVGIVGPTFGEYARGARIVGAVPVELHDISTTPDVRAMFVCNPNNPTGVYYDQSAIERLLNEDPERLMVVDEAYVSFVADRWRSEPLLDEHPNLVILRSLTKDHALPGLRLGYAVASADIAAALEAVRPPWSVNAGALCAGLAMLQPSALEHVAQAVALVTQARTILQTGMHRLGFSVHASRANFVLVDVPNATAFRRALLPHGIVVRDCTSFGLPNAIRIACRKPAECAQLLEVISHLSI